MAHLSLDLSNFETYFRNFSGFANSKEGWHAGGCVYLSGSSWDALGYAERSARRDNESTEELNILVSETMPPEELVEEPMTTASKGNPMKDKPDLPPNQFTKFYRKMTSPKEKKKTEEEEEAGYKDALGRVHENTRVKRGDEFVAPADNVTPRYLIKVKVKDKYKSCI